MTSALVSSRPDAAAPAGAATSVRLTEQARVWALENPEETAQLLADAAGIDIDVATTVIQERSNLDVDGVPGDALLKVLEKIAPVIVDSGDVQGGQDAVDKALSEIIHPDFAEKAVAG